MSDFNKNWIFSTDFSKKNTQISNFHENPSNRRRVVSFRTDGQRDETKLIINFNNFAKAPKNTARNQTEQNSEVSEDTFQNTMRPKSVYSRTIQSVRARGTQKYMLMF